MISKLREQDSMTLTAIGPKFDLEKVLEAGHGILKTLFGRAAMRFPDEMPAALGPEPETPADIDETALRLIAETCRYIRREAFDAADFHVSMAFGPYQATWSPFGICALYGSFNNCVTIFDEPWEDFDPTPTLMLLSRQAPFASMGRAATKFLAETLRSAPSGLEIDFTPDEVDAEMVGIRFPHAAFGAGHDRIRICRYLDENLRKAPEDEEEP